MTKNHWLKKQALRAEMELDVEKKRSARVAPKRLKVLNAIGTAEFAEHKLKMDDGDVTPQHLKSKIEFFEQICHKAATGAVVETAPKIDKLDVAKANLFVAAISYDKLYKSAKSLFYGVKQYFADRERSLLSSYDEKVLKRKLKKILKDAFYEPAQAPPISLDVLEKVSNKPLRALLLIAWQYALRPSEILKIDISRDMRWTGSTWMLDMSPYILKANRIRKVNIICSCNQLDGAFCPCNLQAEAAKLKLNSRHHLRKLFKANNLGSKMQGIVTLNRRPSLSHKNHSVLLFFVIYLLQHQHFPFQNFKAGSEKKKILNFRNSRWACPAPISNWGGMG